MYGIGRLPDHRVEPLTNRVHSVVVGFGDSKILDFAERTLRLVSLNAKVNSGVGR